MNIFYKTERPPQQQLQRQQQQHHRRQQQRHRVQVVRLHRQQAQQLQVLHTKILKHRIAEFKND